MLHHVHFEPASPLQRAQGPNQGVVFCSDEPSLEKFRSFVPGPVLTRRLVDLDFQEIGLIRGPAELSLLGICPSLIFAAEAWPHIDDMFQGSVFYTLPLQARDFQFHCLRHLEGIPANEGCILRVDPMELHWLRPGALAHDHWIALQWEVPLDCTEQFEAALRAGMRKWAEQDWATPVMGGEA